MGWPEGPVPILSLLLVGLLVWHVVTMRRWLTQTPDGLLRQLRAREDRLLEAEAVLDARLEQVAGLSLAEARAQVVARAVQSEAERAAREAATRAQDIFLSAVARVSLMPAELRFATNVELPDAQEVRKRLIGPGGRNAEAFERVTGAELSLNSRHAATVFALNPHTRYLAALTLREIIALEQVNPETIGATFEAVERASLSHTIQRGREAAHQVGVFDLPDPLLRCLGQLAFHWRSGRDLLHRSVVGAQVADLLARELGVDGTLVRRAALLRDIGQTAPAEMDGAHEAAGALLAMEAGEASDICDAIRAHHKDLPAASTLAVLVATADRLVSRGSARHPRVEGPGPASKAHREMQEACEREHGVARVDLLRAGDEVRVLVHPDQVPEGAERALAMRLADRLREGWGQAAVVTVIRTTKGLAGP